MASGSFASSHVRVPTEDHGSGFGIFKSQPDFTHAWNADNALYDANAMVTTMRCIMTRKLGTEQSLQMPHAWALDLNDSHKADEHQWRSNFGHAFCIALAKAPVAQPSTTDLGLSENGGQE